MDQPEKDVPRLVVFFYQPRLASIEQGGSSGLVSLHQLPAGLVDDQEMVVFVDYVHISVVFKSHGRSIGSGFLGRNISTF